MKALQFGAGNIGRGFMAQLFSESGLHTVFADANAELVEKLNERREYTLHLLNAYTEQEEIRTISNFTAVAVSNIAAIAEVFAEAKYASTAVGVGNLEAIAAPIAAGIRERMTRLGAPIDVYLCENRYAAFSQLKEAVYEHLAPPERAWADDNVGFVGTSVARMVPAPDPRFTQSDPLAVAADAHHHLPYDGQAAKAGPPPEGMQPVANFRAEVERKLFTHNLGHAALGYVGYLRGFTYVSDALLDPGIRSIFDGALAETTAALLARYPRDLKETEHKAIIADVAVRFGNPMLRDTVHRVAHDPMRKLSPEDRLIGSARLCLEEGITPTTIARVCGAALHYDFADDPFAVKLQELLSSRGLRTTLSELCKIEPEDTLFPMIEAAYKTKYA